MNMLDFTFINRMGNASLIEGAETVSRNGSRRRSSNLSLPACEPARPVMNDDEGLLHIVKQALQVRTHRELFHLLQSTEVQHLIPHQVMISAWGDLTGPDLKFDVVSAIPGVRTGLLRRCTIGGVLKSLYQTWLVHGRQPLLLHSREVSLTDANCNCALHKSLRGDRSFLVHGVVDARDGGQSLYLAFNTGPIANGRSLERFRLLADPLIAQIDLAFRRIAALKLPAAAPEQAIVASPRALSAREEGLLLLVSQGKSNAEISEILAISACTVKNHMQRIMKKLDAANRTEAVTKFRQVGSAATRPSQLAGN